MSSLHCLIELKMSPGLNPLAIGRDVFKTVEIARTVETGSWNEEPESVRAE